MIELRKLLLIPLLISSLNLALPGAQAQPAPGFETAAPQIRNENSLSYFILDASRSMWGRVGEKTKLEAAKQVLIDRFKLSNNQKTGLMVYGHRSDNDCSDIEEIIPAGENAGTDIATKIQALTARGKSPISDAILQAAQKVANFAGKRRIILITDGVEACDKDPCATARSLKGQGIDLVAIDVIGFSLNSPETKQLECVAEVTGGTYREVSKAEELFATVVAVEEPVAPTPVPTIEAALVTGAELPTPVSASIRKSVPTPATNAAIPKVAVKENGTIILKREAWLLKPFYWKLIDAESGSEVGKYTSFTENVPEGTYMLAWRQYERGSTEIVLKEDVIVLPDRITNISLDTAIRLNIPDFVKQPSYWGLRDPESKEELVTFRTFEPFLVPAGQYELIWRQYDDRAETLSFGPVLIEEGKTNYVTLNSSLRPDPAEWVADDPYYWGLRNEESGEWVARYYDGFEPQLVPPGTYSVVYRQSDRESSDSQLGSIEITADGETEFPINTGVKIKVARAQSRPKSVEFAELDSEGKVVAIVRLDNIQKPMPLKPAHYRISYLASDGLHPTPIVIEEDFDLSSGEFAEVDLDELLNPAELIDDSALPLDDIMPNGAGEEPASPQPKPTDEPEILD